MAYDTNELKQRAVKAIQKYKLIFIEEVAVMIGVNKSTFYHHKLHESDEIKEAMLEAKVSIKTSMRKKWYESENPTLQIGLYKLISTDDEYHRLANTKMDITTREEQPIFQGISHKLNKDDTEENKNKEG